MFTRVCVCVCVHARARARPARVQDLDKFPSGMKGLGSWIKSQKTPGGKSMQCVCTRQAPVCRAAAFARLGVLV